MFLFSQHYWNRATFFFPLCLHLCLTHIIKNSFIASFPAEELTEAGILLVIDGVVIVFVVTFDGSRYFAWLLMGWWLCLSWRLMEAGILLGYWWGGDCVCRDRFRATWRRQCLCWEGKTMCSLTIPTPPSTSQSAFGTMTMRLFDFLFLFLNMQVSKH